MTENPFDPSQPEDPSNPQKSPTPRKPQRPYGQRPSKPGQGWNSDTRNSSNHRDSTGNSTNRKNRPQGSQQQRDGLRKRSGDRFSINENSKQRPGVKYHRKPGERRNNHSNHSEESAPRPPSIPLKAVGGIKALAENGQFGRNWWARRWIHAMEKLMDGRRLSRGQDYASQGQVLSMGEIKNGVAASVQGSRVKPYRVTIQVMPLKSEEWEKALEVLAGQAVFAAKLLAGEMPENIEEAFQSAGLSLFPERPGDLVTQCSCPDWANPCKHVAAAHYILGDRFDEDPFLLFRMRGRTQEQVLDGLRLHRGGVVEEPASNLIEETSTVLESSPEKFWELDDILESFSVQVRGPKVTLPVLRRLGQPEIIRTFMLEDELGPAYSSASEAAMFLAYSDMAGTPVDELPSETELDEID